MNQPLVIERPAYWAYFGVLMSTSLAMYAWGIYELLYLNLFPIVFGFVAPLILSTYLRVIAARRCRAIGWSPLLPWLTYGAVAGCITVVRLLAGHLPATIDDVIGLSGKMVLLFSLADLKFLIIIGCKADAGPPGPTTSIFAAPSLVPADLPGSVNPGGGVADW